MISLDFSILFSLEALVSGTPQSSSSFNITPSRTTQIAFDRLQSVFRRIDGKTIIFASDIVGEYTERDDNNQPINPSIKITQNLETTFLVNVSNKEIFRLIDLAFRPEDLVALQDLPTGFKRVYHVKADELAGGRLIDKSDIIGLAPPILNLEKSKFESLHYQKEQRILAPISEDDNYLQYDFRTAPKGLYILNFRANLAQAKKIYVDPELYAQPPFAVIEVSVPAGQFTLEEYRIEFKNK